MKPKESDFFYESPTKKDGDYAYTAPVRKAETVVINLKKSAAKKAETASSLKQKEEQAEKESRAIKEKYLADLTALMNSPAGQRMDVWAIAGKIEDLTLELQIKRATGNAKIM